MQTIIFLSLVSLCSSQQLLSLSSFKGGNVKNPLNVPTPFGLYLSAYSDLDGSLMNIQITDDDGNSVTLKDLKDMYVVPNSGRLVAYPAPKPLYLISSLTDNQMKSLGGVLYTATMKQQQDQHMRVIDINMAQTLDLQNSGDVDSTVVFLNSRMDTNPVASSIISGWKQAGNALAYLYYGIPLDSIEPTNTQIFSNPMHTDKFDGFFPNIEKFSVTGVAFYLKTYRGVQFRIEPGYYNIDRTTTTSFTTTGFYMKPLNVPDSTITVFTSRDKNYEGSTGANVLGHFAAGGKVTVGEYDDGGSHDEISAPPTDFSSPWSTPNIGKTFQISSTGGQSGQFYVQYFVVQGPLNNSTVTSTTQLPGKQTTTGHQNPETSTKASPPTFYFFISVVISMIFGKNLFM